MESATHRNHMLNAQGADKGMFINRKGKISFFLDIKQIFCVPWNLICPGILFRITVRAHCVSPEIREINLKLLLFRRKSSSFDRSHNLLVSRASTERKEKISTMGSDFNRRKNGENLEITKSWENDAGVKWQKMNFMPITGPDLFPSKEKQIYRFYGEKVFSVPSTATLMKLKSFVVRKFEKKGSKPNARVDVQVRFGRTIKLP